MNENPYQAPRTMNTEETTANKAPVKRRWRQVILGFVVFGWGTYFFGMEYYRTSKNQFLIMFVFNAVLLASSAIILTVPSVERQLDFALRIVIPLGMILGYIWFFLL